LKAEIAYIDDNKLNLDCISLFLGEEFEVKTFIDGHRFLDSYDSSSYTAIILDIHMPVIDGFSLYEKIIAHKHYNGCPIFFFSSDESDEARLKSFDLGAVDFLSRTTRPPELLIRLKSRILFYEKHRSIIEFSNIRVNLTLLKAFLNDRELPLTFIEFKILCLMLRSYPEGISKQQLIHEVWRAEHVLDATIYTHLSNLNNKILDWDYEISGLKSKGVQLTKKDSR
jgi:DNA-binding response OmpR family regulator